MNKPQALSIFVQHMLKKLFLFLLVTTPLLLLAQNADEQLAAQYLDNNEYDKAADLYERLYTKNPSSTYLYENLLTCYFRLRHFEQAEKLVKKQQRRFEGNAYYQVDLGYVYEQAGQPEKAQKVYDGIIQKLSPFNETVTGTANAFRKRKRLKEAVAVYQKARKLNRNDLLFSLELAQLHADLGETALMMQEYLGALEQNPENLEDVQGFLQLYLDKDSDYEQLKQTLLRKLKEKPGSDLYSEMLVWLHVQRKEFENALVYTRAMDKRLKENGKRIIQLADLAVANQRYDAATKAYQEVTLMGNDKPYYINARLGILRARNLKIFYVGHYTDADLLVLEQEYKSFLKEFGKYPFTASSIRELAQLQAYYMHNYDSAIANYNELITMPRLDNRFKAESKLNLGDIYVLKGEVWEAMLLYGQVDKEFLEDPLGQEAKFRNAKLSYYLGEFEWARAQLDVLKTATTQLIANNAMELSLQIQDNTVDSNEEPMRMFSRADLFCFQNHLDEARQVLDSLAALYPEHELRDDIVYKRAEIAMKQKNYAEGARLFEQLYREHGSGILGDNALFNLADVYESKLNDKEAARKYYEEFIEKYPGSFFLTEVRKRYRALRGDDVTN